MTTKNLNLPADLDQKLGELAEQVRKRQSETTKEIEGQKRHQGNLALGVSTLIQRSNDRIEAVKEEQSQLDAIERRAARLLAAEDDGDDEGIEPTPAPPAPPAPPVAVPDPLDDTPRTPRPVTHVTEPPTTPTPVVHVLDVRRWTVWQWLLAFIGAIIGLVIAAATDQVVFDGNGFGQFLWVIAVTGTGFFGGGAIGSSFDN